MITEPLTVCSEKSGNLNHIFSKFMHTHRKKVTLVKREKKDIKTCNYEPRFMHDRAVKFAKVANAFEITLGIRYPVKYT